MSIWQPKFLFWIIFFDCLSSCDFLHFLKINFDGYYIVRTDEGQPRPKYIFNKCGTKIYFLLYRGLVHHHHRVFKSTRSVTYITASIKMSIKQRRSIIHNKVHNSFDKFKKSFIHKMLQIIRSVQNKVFLKTENININISKIILRVSLSKTRKKYLFEKKYL